MIQLSHVLTIHDILIERFGGSKGVRDTGILESAINRPFHTFDGIDLYKTSVEKAAAIFESIISNHPFIDGNKRTAYVLMRIMLLEGGNDISASEDDKYEFVINAAQGQLSFDQIIIWITSNLKKS
jgi:death on curing protein